MLKGPQLLARIPVPGKTPRRTRLKQTLCSWESMCLLSELIVKGWTYSLFNQLTINANGRIICFSSAGLPSAFALYRVLGMFSFKRLEESELWIDRSLSITQAQVISGWKARCRIPGDPSLHSHTECTALPDALLSTRCHELWNIKMQSPSKECLQSSC